MKSYIPTPLMVLSLVTLMSSCHTSRKTSVQQLQKSGMIQEIHDTVKQISSIELQRHGTLKLESLIMSPPDSNGTQYIAQVNRALWTEELKTQSLDTLTSSYHEYRQLTSQTENKTIEITERRDLWSKLRIIFFLGLGISVCIYFYRYINYYK